MNKVSFIKVLFVLISPFLLTISCKNEIDDTFDESSALRMQHALEQYKKILSEAPNGWVMDYFPNDTVPGYTYLMDFGKDGSVKIAGKNEYLNNTYKEEISLYNLLSDNGPILSLSTYNSLFHLFAYPEDPYGTNEDMKGIGLGGDYEFIITGAKEDVITLNGKKRGTTILLRKLPETENWETYLKKLEETRESFFSSKVPTLWLTMNDIQYSITLKKDNQNLFSLVPKGGDAISNSTLMPFVINESGLRFMTSFSPEGTDINVQSFTTGEKGELISQENPSYYIAAQSPIEFFNADASWINSSWKLDPKQMGGKFAEAQATVIANCKSKYKEDFDSFQFKYSGKQVNRVLYFKSGKYEGNFNWETVIPEGSNQISFSYKNICDKNGELYLKNIEGFDQMIQLLTSTAFTVSSESRIKPTTLKFTSTTNAEDWFVVNIQ